MTLMDIHTFTLDRDGRGYHCAECGRLFKRGATVAVERHVTGTGGGGHRDDITTYVHRHADCGQRNAPAADDIYRSVAP